MAENKKRNSILGIILTVAIITLLLLSGPASAVTVGIKSISDTTPNEGDAITFLAQMDIHSPDVINVQNVSLNITDGAGIDYGCTFYTNGTEISCNSTINIDACTMTGTYNDSLAGYGYGYGYNGSFGYINVSQSYGYGYTAGYGSDSFNTSMVAGDAELVCNVTWTTPSVSADKAFSIKMAVNVEGGYYFSEASAPTVTVTNVVTSTGTGGGNGASVTASYSVSSAQLEKGYSKALGVGADMHFTGSDSKLHTVTVTKLTTTTATITVSSATQTKTLKVGEQWKVDLDADKTYDLLVELLSISDNKANVLIKSIAEKSEEAKAEEITGAAAANITETAKEAEAETASYAWIVVIVVIIAIIVAYYVLRKRRE